MAEKKPGHTLADHQYGADAGHTHEDGESDHDHDHDHDDFGATEGAEGSGLWVQDHVSLTSVGIDIGSSGTQLIFSRKSSWTIRTTSSRLPGITTRRGRAE